MDILYYEGRYWRFGELGFPHSERTYFDHIATEYSYNSKEQKLLDIGYLLWHGYDVRAQIHRTYSDAHPSVSENDVRQTLCFLLAELLNKSWVLIERSTRNKTTDEIIDLFFDSILQYYHYPVHWREPHYLKDPMTMTETELRVCNPWHEVADKCIGNKFIFSEIENLVCSADKEMIGEFNATAKQEHQYKLNVPAYPWYGNPLKAKVIVLSLNPGYVERETTIAKLFKHLPAGLVEGYAVHLRSMLTFDGSIDFLPANIGLGITARDLANIHQSYYWIDRLTSAFVNDETNLTFEEINQRFAVVQYIGYSSKKYKPFKQGQYLPSQHYTKQLIHYILRNHPDTIFIVPRAEKKWREFLGNLWDDNRFFVSNLPISQRFSKSTLGEPAYAKNN